MKGSTYLILDDLRRAGLSVGHTAFHEIGGLVWVIRGRSGENQFRADGATATAAWKGAAEQAALTLGISPRAANRHRAFAGA
jgi:hypothetical protein